MFLVGNYSTLLCFDGDIRRQLCGAYCSVSELYLTDLCCEPNAEQNCESALQTALELDDPQSSRCRLWQTCDCRKIRGSRQSHIY